MSKEKRKVILLYFFGFIVTYPVVLFNFSDRHLILGVYPIMFLISCYIVIKFAK